MTILKLRKEKKKDEGTPNPAAVQPEQGQNALSPEVIAQIAQAVAVATAKGIQTVEPKAPVDKTVEAAFNLGDRDLKKLNEVLGESTTEALVGALSGIANQSSSDAAILLQAIQEQQTGTTSTLTKIQEQITGMATTNPEREWAARGYNLFTDNQDETLEYLEETNEAAGALFGGNLVDAFEKAQEEHNYEFLDRVRAGVVEHLAISKKDHAGVDSSGAVSLSKSEKQKLKDADDAYQADRTKALSETDPKKRLAAVLDMGQEKPA